MSIFISSKVLGYENDEILGPTGAVAIPEFNTRFTRQGFRPDGEKGGVEGQGLMDLVPGDAEGHHDVGHGPTAPTCGWATPGS